MKELIEKEISSKHRVEFTISQIKNNIVKVITCILIMAMAFCCIPGQSVSAGTTDAEMIETMTNKPITDDFDGYTVKIAEGIDSNMESDIEDTNCAEQIADQFVSIESPEDVLKFAKPEDIEYIEPNYYLTLDEAEEEEINDENIDVKWPDATFPEGPPNDAWFGSWNETVSGKAFTVKQWNLDMVNASYAWQQGLRGQGVKVGIIDTGVNIIGTDLNAANYIAGINYYKSVGGNSSTADLSGHGTKVLSVIASQVNNEENIAGIVDKIKYIPLRVSKSSTKLSTGADVVKAVNYAEDNNIWVLNMSMGTYYEYKPLEDQVNHYAAKGGILVASSGNDNCTTKRYPAQYNNAVGAGALNKSGKRWESSSTSGANHNGAIDAMAPGQSVPMYTGENTNGTGTSYATAHITALAAAAKQNSNGRINVVEFKKLLQQTCKQDESYVQGVKNDYYGYGIIDFKEFLSAMNEENSSGIAPVLPYAITYKKNGGKFSGSYPTTYYGTSAVTLPTSSKIKKAGHSFKGWYLQPGFSGTRQKMIAVGMTGNKTFYAKWQAKTYKLKFNVNGGKTLKKKKRSKTVTYGKKVGKIPIPKRKGYNFVGWFTKKKSGGTEYTKSKKHKLTKTVTLYARWTKKKVAKFNANGGARYDYAKAITKGKKIGSLPKAYRTGYTFKGWYTKKRGGKKITKSYKIKKNKTITLYAHWKKQ